MTICKGKGLPVTFASQYGFASSLLFWLLTSAAYSAEYSMEPKVGVAATFDSNALLTTNPNRQIRLNGTRLSPEVMLGINTESLTSNLGIRLDFRNYDIQEWDTDDQAITYQLSKRFETQTLSFNAGYVRDSARTSEFSGSGIASADRHERQTAGLVWDYFPTPRIFSRVNLDWSNDEYDDSLDIRTDYKRYNLGLLAGYQLNEKLSFNLFGSGGVIDFGEIEQIVFYAPANNPLFGFRPLQTANSKSESRTLRIGTQYDFAEKWSLDASLGKTKNTRIYEVTKTDFRGAGFGATRVDKGDAICDPEEYWGQEVIARDLCIDDTTSRTDSADVSLKYEGLKNNGSLAYGESTSPSSDGSVFSGRTVTFAWDYRINEKQKLYTTIVSGDNETVFRVASLSASDRRYKSVRIVHYYEFLENWEIRSSYIYREQKYDRDDDTANSNAVDFGIVYTPNKSSWSR
jgi:hypothetical protein